MSDKYICDASGEGTLCCALIELTPERARSLLTYLPLVEAAYAKNDNFYGIEFFDYATRWGMATETSGTNDFNDNWREFGDEDEFEEEEVEIPTMTFTQTCIVFRASAKHSDEINETNGLSYDLLRKIAADEPQEESGL